jgi:hypothetical protein
MYGENRGVIEVAELGVCRGDAGGGGLGVEVTECGREPVDAELDVLVVVRQTRRNTTPGRCRAPS